MATIDDLKKVRLEKLEILRAQGIDPYPASVRRDQTISVARDSEGKPVAVVGRIMGIRGHGKIFFLDLVDATGKIQIAIKDDMVDTSSAALIQSLDLGDFIAVQGEVGKTNAGEVTVFAKTFQLTAKAILPLPDQWYGLKDVEERYRKRYLDMLMNPEVVDRLNKRARIISAIRELLDKKGFVEVETPTLQPIYGGGFARPFSTHHNALDSDFYLRISDEMYLKRLIVGGLEKVYEITKVFRNEGIDHDHNPEFTMFEAQIAHEDYRYGMDIIEEIFEYAAQKIHGSTEFTYQNIAMSLKRPWKRYKLLEAIREFTGVDPLSWQTLEQAKADIHKMNIPMQKRESLQTMRSIGEVMAFAFEETVEEKLIQPTIIYDYPIEISPLAKKCEDPRFTQRFELFAFGSELGNNYSELNDPIDLEKRFIQEKDREAAGFDEAQQTDYDYLTAIKHGFPPTCGLGVGIDRLVMLLTDATSIKDVIAFPTLKPDVLQPKPAPIHKSIPVAAEEAAMETVASGLTKVDAKELLHSHMQNQNLRRHCYAVGFAMRALAGKLKGDPDVWEVLGILHDADWEETKDTPHMHTIKTIEWLKDKGITNSLIIRALQSHNRKFTQLAEIEGTMEWALETCDELTGFIVAVALIRPEKTLATVTLESVLKKWKNKEFAKAVDRDQIALCEEKLGISVSDFITIVLTAMQENHEELGL